MYGVQGSEKPISHRQRVEAIMTYPYSRTEISLSGIGKWEEKNGHLPCPRIPSPINLNKGDQSPGGGRGGGDSIVDFL